MPFGNISTFYLPIAANAGASLWGTDVRKLLGSAEASADTTTIQNFGTGGAATRVVDPYTNSTTATGVAHMYGWGVAKSDMNSVSGAKRMFPAGDHTLHARMRDNSGLGVSTTVVFYAYRVAASTNTRTLLGSGNDTVSLPAVSAFTDVVVPISLAEIVLEADESIMYGCEVQASGVVTGRTITFATGLSTTNVRVETPGLKTLADGDGVASGVATGDATPVKIINADASASGLGDAVAAAGATASSDFMSSGVGAATGDGAATGAGDFASSGIGAADGVLGAFGSMDAASAGVAAASGVFGAVGSMDAASAGVGAASGVLGATGSMAAASSGSGFADAFGSSVAATDGAASGQGAASGLASIVLGSVGTCDIGGGGDITVNIRPTILFDD